uniref:Uncharacterized protein n=1 Tax=Globodera rostochiensis TaxID=31243 RepID=A0A914I1K5_GLORO
MDSEDSTHLGHSIRNESSRGRSPQELDALRKHLLSILNQIEHDLHLRGNGNVWLRHGGHGQAVDREYQMNELQHFRDNILAAPTIKSLKKIKAKLPTLEVLSDDEKIDAIALKSEWVNVLEDAQMEFVRVDKCRKLMKKFDEVQILNEIVKIAKWSDAYHFIYVDEKGVPFGRKFKNAAEQIERCWHALDEHEYPYKMLKNCRVPKKVDRHDDYVNWVKKTNGLRKGKSAFKCKTWTQTGSTCISNTTNINNKSVVLVKQTKSIPIDIIKLLQQTSSTCISNTTNINNKSVVLVKQTKSIPSIVIIRFLQQTSSTCISNTTNINNDKSVVLVKQTKSIPSIVIIKLLQQTSSTCISNTTNINNDKSVVLVKQTKSIPSIVIIRFLQQTSSTCISNTTNINNDKSVVLVKQTKRDDQDEAIRYFTPEEDLTPKRRFPSSIDADEEYNRGDQELRKVPIFAARHPDLWLNYEQLIDWNCSSLKGEERRRCEGWEAIYRAIKRYIKFISIQNTPKNDAFFANIAVQPRFMPALQQIDSRSTENTAILNQKMPKLDGKPMYEQRAGMELTQVMLLVRNVHKRHGTITEPVRFLNRELVEKVRGWAEFLGNFLKSPPHKRTYRQIDEHKIEDARHLLEWISKNNFILEGMAEAKLIPEPPWPQLHGHGSAAAVQQKQIGPTTDINEAQYRDALNFARTRSHKLWLSDQPKNVAWKCQEMSSKMRKRCMDWASIHWAIRHYIKFLTAIEGKSLAHLSESELPKIALFPKLKPSIARGRVKSEERLQRQQPFFEHNGFMELTQVMRKVESVYELRNSQNFPKPLLFMNFDLIDNVWGWAKFAAEPGKYLSYQKANGTVVNSNDSKQFKSLLNEAQSVLKHVLGKMQENWLFPNFDQNILTPAPMPFIDTKIDDENRLGRNLGKAMPKAEDDPKNDRTNTLYHDAMSDFSQTLSDEAEHLSEKQHHLHSESSSVNSMKRERRTEAREILRKLRSGKVSFQKNGEHYPLSPTEITEILAKIDQANSEKEIEEAAAKFPDGEEKVNKKVKEENHRYKKAKNESDHFLSSVSAQQKWQQIERTLREQLEKRGTDRYINRQKIADPYDAGQLIIRQNDEKRIILIPREEEIIRTVYHVANPEGTHGKLLGKNIKKSWKNAKKCLNLMDDQNAEKSVIEFCKMAIEAEDRAEIYEKWASIGKEMQRGIPLIYMKNDEKPMKVNELLLLLEKAFNALVNDQQRHKTNRRTAPNIAKSYAIADQLGGRIPVDYGQLKGYDNHKLVEQTEEEEERKASEVRSKAAIKQIGRYQNKEITNSPQHNYRGYDGPSEVDSPTNRESPNSDVKNNKKSVAHNFFENIYQKNKHNQMEKRKAEEEAHKLAIDKKKAEEEQRKRNWNEKEKARLTEQKKKKTNERHNEEERRNREKELHREWEKKEAGAMRNEREKHIEMENRREELMEREKKKAERERKKQFREEMIKRQETWNTKSIRTGEGAGAKPKSHNIGSMY